MQTINPEMYALSVKQPYAWLICAGYKDVENRSWKIGRSSRHGPYSTYHQANFTIDLPCRIYVHSGKGKDIDAIDMILYCQWDWFPHDAEDAIFDFEDANSWSLGAIIGEVDIVDCIKDSKSPWAVEGQYHFILKNPVLYKEPILCPGRLGFFKPSLN
jgi:hypothetical protein